MRAPGCCDDRSDLTIVSHHHPADSQDVVRDGRYGDQRYGRVFGHDATGWVDHRYPCDRKRRRDGRPSYLGRRDRHRGGLGYDPPQHHVQEGSIISDTRPTRRRRLDERRASMWQNDQTAIIAERGGGQPKNYAQLRRRCQQQQQLPARLQPAISEQPTPEQIAAAERLGVSLHFGDVLLTVARLAELVDELGHRVSALEGLFYEVAMASAQVTYVASSRIRAAVREPTEPTRHQQRSKCV